MAELGKERPFFHSEADLQHALAWLLHSHFPESKVRLEYRFDVDGHSRPIYLDIWMSCQGERIGIELKYLTRSLNTAWKDEVFSLKNQGAQDVSAYDCVKDIARIEKLVEVGSIDLGYAIVITNDDWYWKIPSHSRPASVDAFRLHEGRRLQGTLGWPDGFSTGTSKGRETPHMLRGCYNLAWQPFSDTPGVRNGEFRYQLFEVPPLDDDSRR